jgi:hypothetical protein
MTMSARSAAVNVLVIVSEPHARRQALERRVRWKGGLPGRAAREPERSQRGMGRGGSCPECHHLGVDNHERRLDRRPPVARESSVVGSYRTDIYYKHEETTHSGAGRKPGPGVGARRPCPVAPALRVRPECPSAGAGPGGRRAHGGGLPGPA